MGNLQLLYRRIQRVSAFLRPMHIPIHSANTGFFLILSLFPLLPLLLGLLQYTSLGVRELMDFLEGLLPQMLLPVAEFLVEASWGKTSGLVLSVSAVAALWSASRGMYGLRGGLNAVCGNGENQGYLGRRMVSMLYTFLFLLVLVGGLVVYVAGKAMADYLWMTTNPILMKLMSIVDLQFCMLLGLQTALFAGFYSFLPARRRSFRGSLPGAAMAALGWLVSSKLFSVYVAWFSGYTNVFGTIYALALGMLWLYFCISMIFYGAALNRWLLERKRKK